MKSPPSVRPFPLYLSNGLTFDFDLLCVSHDNSSPGIEGQGQPEPELQLNLNAVGLTRSLI